LLVAGISVVADHSLGLYVVALAAATAITLAVAAAPLERTPSRAMSWLVRLSAAIAVAGSAALIAHAVFDL
jgi:hypothetical protein